MKLWTGWIALALTTGGAWAQDDAAELGKAGAKAQEWRSYAFKTTSKVEGMPQRNGGGGGGQENPGARSTEGEYVAEKGLHAKSGDSEVIRVGTKSAVKGSDGKWTAPDAGGGGGRQGGRGRGGRGMANLPPPHESFKDLGKSFKSVTKSSDGDLTVYSGDLTADGVTKLGGGRGFGRGGGRDGGGGGGNVESTGTAKIWVDADGNIVKIEVKTEVKGKFQEREFDIKTERTTEFSKIGGADFEIPKEADEILKK